MAHTLIWLKYWCWNRRKFSKLIFNIYFYIFIILTVLVGKIKNRLPSLNENKAFIKFDEKEADSDAEN